MQTIIKSEKFILRPFRKGDEKSLRMNINDYDIYKFTERIPYPYTLKDANWWIKYCKSEKAKKKLIFAIEIEKEVVGCVALESIEWHRAEIGYWLSKKYWNNGIISDAIKIITNIGFKNLKLKRIYADVVANNKASIKVLEKNGYKYEGRLRKNLLKDGKLIDCLLYARVK